MQKKSHYSLLDLRLDATVSQIDAAYKQMLRLYQSSGGQQDSLVALQEAHAVLTDPVRRSAYDAELRQHGGTKAVAGPAAEPGKALRWVGLLAALILPIGGIAWWVNRPSPVRLPVTAPGSTSGEQASASASAEKGVNYGNAQTKYSERTEHYNRQMAVSYELGSRAVRARDGHPLEGQEAENEAREIELLRREHDWLDARIREIDDVELPQAAKGNLLPKQVYHGERVK
ncbi:J domain-containing protein [Chitinimonas naiadis]